MRGEFQSYAQLPTSPSGAFGEGLSLFPVKAERVQAGLIPRSAQRLSGAGDAAADQAGVEAALGEEPS